MYLSEPQAGASSSSTPFSTHSFTHDVFLSFRGPDTRNNFTSHLHSNLVNRGINTFIDNDLTRGEDITKELLDVIEGSRISIVVFSADYASSKWCLDELVKILQCKESKQQIVYPIFYKVEPWEIRKQIGQVGEAIARLSIYEDNLTKMESWKAALLKAGSFSGWLIQDKVNEANAMNEIISEISTKINPIPLDVAAKPVGIESRVKKILELLNVGEENQQDPHMIGIWGAGGMGKTTLAKAVYNSINHGFEHSCFMANVREKSNEIEGLVKLQNNFLSKIIRRNPPTVTDVDNGITVLKNTLKQKRVLLVLDDVDHLNQLRKLAGGCDWFGQRSRVIITTREKNCLISHKVHPDQIYEVEQLNDQEALELFNFHALKGSKCEVDFSELATDVIRYVKGIPLVLEVLGSDLCSKNKDEWKGALQYYKRHPMQEVQQTLKRSYDALEDQIKEVFLHIACFFKGETQSKVTDVLESCDLDPIYGMRILQEKALIKIEKDNSIWMHDLIENMGKEIVEKESPEIGRRSRIWRFEDVRYVLEERMGTHKIKGIKCGRFSLTLQLLKKEKIQLNGESFKNLISLQIFIVVDGSFLEGESVGYLPNQLRTLRWEGCLLRSLPMNFNPSKIGVLHMTGPVTNSLVDYIFKSMPLLIAIELVGCNGLLRIPDLSGLKRLKKLFIQDCKYLHKVDRSVGRLNNLVELTVIGCSELKFPKSINLKSLETLQISYCPLAVFPKIEGEMKSLTLLDLSGTHIEELPSSIFDRLQCLKDLNLQSCGSLVTFPTKSESLPRTVVSSTTLNVSSTTLTRLQVNLQNCQQLKEISDFPREIDGLNVSGCESLERISKLSKILEGKDSKMFRQLDLTGCKKLYSNLAEELKKRELIREEEEEEFMAYEWMEEAEKEEEEEEEFMADEWMNEAEKEEEEEEEFMADEWMNEAEKEEEEEEEFMADEWMNEAEKEEEEEEEFMADEWMDEAEKELKAEKEEAEKELKAKVSTALMSLFLSCGKSEEFQVKLPFPIPIRSMSISERELEFQQSSICDKKGLALCIKGNLDGATPFVYINGIKFIGFESTYFHDRAVEDMWVHYIPMVTVMKRLSECGRPQPDMFRIMFRLKNNYFDEGSWSFRVRLI